MVIRMLKHTINKGLVKGCCTKKEKKYFMQNKMSTIGVNTKVLKTLQKSTNVVQ